MFQRSTAKRTSPSREPRWPLLQCTQALVAFVSSCAVALTFAPEASNALSFDLEFRSSTYQTVGTDTYDSLVTSHGTGALLSTQTVDAIDGISSIAFAGVNSDYSTLITTSFTAAVTGVYEFEVGTDWGRGGASQAVHAASGTVVDSFFTTDDVWWANDWNNADVFSMVLNVTAGETYDLGWVGFEGCCGGNVSFRFSVDGSAPLILDETNFLPFEIAPVPEPGTGALVAMGLAALGLRGRHRA